MKHIIYLLLVVMAMSMTSCATILTPDGQHITFIAPPKTRIYDGGKLIARTNKDGVAFANIDKKLHSKTLVAEKTGFQTTPFELTATFNYVSLGNLIIGGGIGFGVDLLTGKICKWKDNIIEIKLFPDRAGFAIAQGKDSILLPNDDENDDDREDDDV